MLLVAAAGANLGANEPEIVVDQQHASFRVTGATANKVSKGGEALVMRGHEDIVTAVALSADGTRALSGGADTTVRLWNAKSGKLLRTMRGHEGIVNAVALSADGTRALSSSEDDDRPYHSLRFWDAVGGWPIHEMQADGLDISYAVALSADGARALSAFSSSLYLWDTISGTLIREMWTRRAQRPRAVALSADGTRALSGDYYSVRLWNMENGKLLRTMRGHEDIVTAVALSADGTRALSGGEDTTVRLWNAKSGKLLRTMRGHEGIVSAVALSADGTRALSGGGDRWKIPREVDSALRLWDTEGGSLIRTMRGHEGMVNAVALSADGTRALSGGEDATVRLWDLSVIDTQQALRRAAENYVQQAMEMRIGPAIPKPTLPPIAEYKKDSFEDMVMFEQRMARARTERERQIKDIQARYRGAVEKRNAKVRDFNENQRRKVRLTAHARAVAEVYGHPVLRALRDENGEPKYEWEAKPPRMHVALQFEHTEDSEDWVFEVPPGYPARSLFAALEAGEISATTEYRLEGDVLSLVAVYASHGDAEYTGTPTEDGDYSAPQSVVRVLGQNDQLSLPHQQNPNLKDEAFEQYEVQQRRAFDDDIPDLYEKAKAAKLDSRKWLFVVGIEKYPETDDISHSRRSTEWFAKAAAKVLGITPGRQTVLLDEEATGLAITHQIDRMLAGVREQDHIYFYYSGHGIAVPEQDNAPFVLPQNAIPDFVGKYEEYRVENIYRKLMQSKAEQVIAFMGSCFTGQTDGVSVLKGVAGTRLVPKQFKPPTDGKLATLTAGTEKQYSGMYGEKGHRMFSYFLIKELLKGEHASIGTLHKKVSADVTSTTMDLGGHAKQQDPVLQGNPLLSL